MTVVKPGVCKTGTIHLSTFDKSEVPQVPDLRDPLPHYPTVCGREPCGLDRVEDVDVDDLCNRCRGLVLNDEDVDVVGVVIE